jgi:hypothetical protein
LLNLFPLQQNGISEHLHLLDIDSHFISFFLEACKSKSKRSNFPILLLFQIWYFGLSLAHFLWNEVL